MNLAAIQNLPVVNHVDQLTAIERHRLEQFKQGVENTINARNDLHPLQKEAILQELTERINQIAFDRLFYRESPNISLRGIHLQTTHPETLCEIFTKGSVIGLGIVVVSSNPIIGGAALVTSYISRQIFDDECFLNKFFRWIGCVKKPQSIDPLILFPLNPNQPGAIQ